MRRAVLLVNLGTPDAPTVTAVRRCLREFLSDPRVIDMNPVGRFLLLNLIILPFRPKRSAHAYQQVWTKEGSPLLVWSQRQRDGVAKRLPDEEVVLAMRYGNPSLTEALARLDEARVRELVVVPLYPQDAGATTGSTLEAVFKFYEGHPRVPAIKVVPPFFQDEGFINAWVARMQASLASTVAPEHVVFTYHGLPERQVVRQGGGDAKCLTTSNCCATFGSHNAHCYRAQCFETTRLIATKLGLKADQVSTSFQSRLGKVPWIRPYTDELLDELVKKGVKRAALVAPAFVADCLETLEELGLRATEQFKARGGESLTVLPCINADDAWLDALTALVTRAQG